MATLTSAGAVNLTASTNWSPAQIPQAGDDLIIGAHTLTLDADLTLNSITFTSSGNGRLTTSGSNRAVNVTNGFTVNTSFSGVTLVAATTAGQNLTLRGTWRPSGGVFLNAICSSSGGNITLATIGDNPSAVLVEGFTTGAFAFTASWSAGTLTTIGRLDLPSWTQSTTLVTMTGGTWNHTNTGTSLLGAGVHIVFLGTGTSGINWSGDLVSASSTINGIFRIVGSTAWSITGVLKRTASNALSHVMASGASPVVDVTSTATGTVTGVICVSATSRACSLVTAGGAGCRINWRNQSLTIPSSDAIIILNGSGSLIDMTGLNLSNAGRFVYVESGSAQAVVDGTTLITNTTTSAQACVVSNSGALDGKVVNLPSDLLRMPVANEVAADADPFGFTASPITPTGLVVDPAVIAAAVGAALGAYDTNGVASRDDLADVGVDLTPVLEKLPVSGRALSDEDYVAPNNAGIDAIGTIVSGLNNLSAADVNAQVVDALSVDTYGELSAPPAATSSLKDKVVWTFQWLRNKSTQTATQRKLYADDGTTVISTETVSDDGTTYTKGEQS